MIYKDQMDDFVKYCKESIKAMFGEDPKKSDSYCRIVNEKRFDRLKELIESVGEGKTLTGGQTDKNELYIAPTIIAPVEAAGHPLMEEEIFGPILPIVPIEDIQEAITIINSK